MAELQKLWRKNQANYRYWVEREKAQRELYIKEEAQQQKEIERIYNDMFRWAEDEINRFYGKYADAEGIDITEAMKRVSQADIAEYERLAKQYVEDKDFRLLSRFSRVRLCVTPEMAAHQALPPWDSSGKNTGVGCHFLLQCIKAKSESKVAQSCPTLRDPMDCTPLQYSCLENLMDGRAW